MLKLLIRLVKFIYENSVFLDNLILLHTFDLFDSQLSLVLQISVQVLFEDDQKLSVGEFDKCQKCHIQVISTYTFDDCLLNFQLEYYLFLGYWLINGVFMFQVSFGVEMHESRYMDECAK